MPERPRLDYEATLAALLTFVGRKVIVWVAAADGNPPHIAILIGELRYVEADPSLQSMFEEEGFDCGETMVLNVGEGDAYVSIVERDFVDARWTRREQLTVRVGNCDFTIQPRA